MIHPVSRTIEWMTQVAAENNFPDIALIEKSIRAFSLLESLVLSGCPFEQLPIQSRFLKLEGEPVMVNVPSKADMLGDKLTAFAPNTTGIPYFKGKKDCSMEIIKQLVDIAHGEKYTIDSAITNASKAAYLSRLIANGVPTAVHFNPQNIDSLRDAVIKDPLHTKLNKLRKSNIEAFFYWNEIGKIHNTKM